LASVSQKKEGKKGLMNEERRKRQLKSSKLDPIPVNEDLLQKWPHREHRLEKK